MRQGSLGTLGRNIAILAVNFSSEQDLSGCRCARGQSEPADRHNLNFGQGEIEDAQVSGKARHFGHLPRLYHYSFSVLSVQAYLRERLAVQETDLG
jgi:hypothetical protein